MYDMQLQNQLMRSIGFYVDNNGYVKDQDTERDLIYENKKLKLPINNNVIITKGDKIFNPLNNIKLLRSLFKYYLEKIYNLEGRYFPIYYEVPNPNKKFYNKKAIYANENNNVTYKSKFYYNEVLRIIDIILTIDGYENVDLSIYDNNFNNRNIV